MNIVLAYKVRSDRMCCFICTAATQTLTTLQALVLASWLWISRPTGLCFDPRGLDVARFAGGVVLLALSAALVRTAFTSVGRQGIYYGSRLMKGRKAAGELATKEAEASSCHSLYNLLYKPQYVGSALALWAVIFALGPQLPDGSWFIAAFHSLMYSITCVMEDYL